MDGHEPFCRSTRQAKPIVTGLLGLIVTGSAMWLKIRSHPAKQIDRRWHRLVGPIALLPISISAFTGLIYTLAHRWFGLTHQQVSIFLAG